MIKKILDNYFSKKVINYIEKIIIFRNLDYKIINENDCFSVKIKRKEYNDKEYKRICFIRKENSIYWLMNFKVEEELLEKVINDYLKGDNK